MTARQSRACLTAKSWAYDALRRVLSEGEGRMVRRAGDRLPAAPAATALEALHQVVGHGHSVPVGLEASAEGFGLIDVALPNDRCVRAVL